MKRAGDAIGLLAVVGPRDRETDEGVGPEASDGATAGITGTASAENATTAGPQATGGVSNGRKRDGVEWRLHGVGCFGTHAMRANARNEKKKYIRSLFTWRGGIQTRSRRLHFHGRQPLAFHPPGIPAARKKVNNCVSA